MKIIQLSDLHLIGEDSSLLYGIDPYERLELALKSIEKNHSDATFIVITGDLTDNSSHKGYEVLKSIVDKSSIPMHLILGNHDNRDIFSNYFPDLFEDEFVQYTKKIDGKVFLFLDTLVEDESYGEFCDIRMKWLKNRLEEYRKESIYIFMHHHPIDSGLYEMDNLANFKSKELFWSLLKKYKNIKHISFGHLHRIMHSMKDNISLHSTRSTTFQVAYRPDEKSEFLTNDESPTYAIMDIMQDGNPRIHHHEFMNEDRFYRGKN